jgi:hypothetical protein
VIKPLRLSYDIGCDATEIDWGEVTVWEPPHRIAYLWHIRRDRSEGRNEEITFVVVAEDATRLDIVQPGWERLGAAAEEWRDANRGGWSGLLPHFADACLSIRER